MQLYVDKLGKVSITIEEGYWDINKDYDKLVVVEREGTFGTFISRKPVPAGTELSNRTYWIPFSSLREDIILDYNAFLDKYGKELADAKDNILDLYAKVEDLLTTKETADKAVEIANEVINKAEEIIDASNSAKEETIRLLEISKTKNVINVSNLGYKYRNRLDFLDINQAFIFLVDVLATNKEVDLFPGIMITFIDGNRVWSVYQYIYQDFYSDTTKERYRSINYWRLVLTHKSLEYINEHISNKQNPHNVTKEQLGLQNVTNDAQVKRNEMGVANGVATLNENGTIPASQLPSYVDEVLEFHGLNNFPSIGSSGIIYIDTTTNKTYRWTGSSYIEISKSIAIGTASGSAYPGDLGWADHNEVEKLSSTKLGSNICIGNTSGDYISIGTDRGNVDIQGNVNIQSGVSIGQDVYIQSNCRLGQANIEDNVKIGNNTTIEGSTHIGGNVNIPSGISILSNIPSNVDISQNTNIAEGASIGNYAIIGNNANIKDNAVLGTNSNIVKAIITDASIGYANIGITTIQKAEIGTDVDIKDQIRIYSNIDIGTNNTIGTNNSIGHNNNIGDHISIGNNSSIGENAYIGNNTSISESVTIGASASIGASATVGNSSSIGANVTIGNNSSIGENISISENSNIGANVIIGNSSELGANAKIRNNSILGTNSNIGINNNIGNSNRIYDNVTIGTDVKIDNTTIGTSTITNFTVLAGTIAYCDISTLIVGSAYIGNNTNIGNRVTIGNDVNILSNAKIYNAIIGTNTVIRNSVSIENDVTIGNMVSIGPSVVIGQSVSIYDYVNIGQNVTINDNANIGYNASLGDYASIGESVSISSSNIRNAYIGSDAENYFSTIYADRKDKACINAGVYIAKNLGFDTEIDLDGSTTYLCVYIGTSKHKVKLIAS